MRAGIVNKRNTINRICFCCKSSIPLDREHTQDVVFYDNHFFHRRCFKTMNCIRRKCTKCKKEIIVSEINDDKNVFYDGSYYHKNCFEDLCNTKKTKKWKMASQNIDQYVVEANENLSRIFNNKKTDIVHLNDYAKEAVIKTDYLFAESDVNHFLQEQYGITSIGDIYNRNLTKVYNGTYRHSEGTKIPPHHLLDMWQAKIDKLKSIRARNIVMGKEMSPQQMIVYDLAVITSKYNAYLDWLNKQSVIETTSISYYAIPIVTTSKKAINKTGENEDINNLLEEIFE